MATAQVPEDAINSQTSTKSWDVAYIDVFGVVREPSGQLSVTTDDSIVLSCNKDKPVTMETLRWVSNETNALDGSVDVTISFYNIEMASYDYIFVRVDESASQQCLAELQRLLLLKFDASIAEKEYFHEIDTVLKAQPLYRKRIEVSIQDVTRKTSSTEDHYLVLADIECLSLFSKSHPQPVHQLFFWMTASPNSVEEVRLLIEKFIIISSRTTEFKFNADDDFLLKIRKLTPRKKHLFTDCEAMVTELLQKKFQPQVTRSTQGVSLFDTGASGWRDSQADRLQRVSQFDTGATAWRYSEVDRLQSGLDVAVKTFEDNEDMQNFWIAIEHDINELINSGEVPETDHKSGGLNPESVEHLEKCLRDVEDHFKENNIPVAVSRLQACRELFKSSSVPGINSFFSKDDLSLLKALYMKSLQT